MIQGSWRGWPSWRAGREEAALPGDPQAAAAVAAGSVGVGENCSQWTQQHTGTAEGAWPSLHRLEGHCCRCGEYRVEAVRPQAAWWSQGPH